MRATPFWRRAQRRREMWAAFGRLRERYADNPAALAVVSDFEMLYATVGRDRRKLGAEWAERCRRRIEDLREVAVRRGRRTVAFEQLEERDMRVFRHAAVGMSVDEITAEYREHRRGVPLATYWCAACFSENGHAEHHTVQRVYDGSKVPDDAECSDCGIPIRDLQEQLRT